MTFPASRDGVTQAEFSPEFLRVSRFRDRVSVDSKVAVCGGKFDLETDV